MMRKYGARVLDIGSIEDGGDRGWAVSKAPSSHAAGRLPFISTKDLHAMCYGPPQLRKSPAAIAMQARQTRVNASGQRGQSSGHRPLSRVSTASASAPLLLEDARLQRMNSRQSQMSHLQLQDWSRPQTAFAIQDWNSMGQLAALQDHSRPYTAQDLVAVVERRLGDDAGRGELDMVEARSMRSNSHPNSSRSRTYHSPGPPSRSSSKGPGSRKSSKGPGSRSSSKGPSPRPISALSLSNIGNHHRPSTSSGALALVDKGRRISKSSRSFSRASKSSRAASSASHTEDEDLASPTQKALKDRKLSSGACLGLDLTAFEHRKSKMLQKSELPPEPERPSTASRRPSGASSRTSRRPTEVGTPRSKVEDKAEKKIEAPISKEQTKGIFRAHMEAKAKEAFQKRNKGTSLVLGGEDQDPVQLPGNHLLPATVRALDLPTALDMFEHYDKIRAHGGTGLLDRKALAEMLFAIAQGKEAMTEEWSNAIFDALDFEHRGLLDRDQILGWAFGMHNNYHSNIRRRFHKVLKDTQVQELLEALAIGSGFRMLNQLLLTKEELWFVVDTGRVPLSRKASDELHAYLAVGHAAEGLDCHEFLNWLFPGRELRTLQLKVEELRQQLPQAVEELDEEGPVIEKSKYKAPKRPLWENRLKQHIVLEFTCATGCLSKIQFIEENLEAFSELQLDVTVVINETLRETCYRVVAKVGREICLWDAGTMKPYREDPFETKASSWAWLKKYIMTLCPDAIQASQVAMLKNQKKQLRRLKALAKARRRSSAVEEDPDEAWRAPLEFILAAKRGGL